MGARLTLVGGISKPGIEPAPRPIRAQKRKATTGPVAQDGEETARKNRLTDEAIKGARPPRGSVRKLSDGQGLYVAVMAEGGKLWRMKYRFPPRSPDAKERSISFGSYPDVTLDMARSYRDQAREWLKLGKDPVIERRVEKATAIARTAADQATTFSAIAEEWLTKQNFSPDHVIATRRRLDFNLFPHLGSLPVAAIKPVIVLETLRHIERRGALEVAAKCRQLCGQVFRYAIATGRAESDPAANLRGAIKPPKKESRATIPLKGMATLFKAIDKVPAELNTRLALYWVILTACRTGEMRGATWDEIEDGGKTWRIPKERMKMDREHVVPLSTQAQAILKQAQQLRQNRDDDALVFPGFTRHGGLSENALLAMLARAGYFGRQTSHGFRASFSTWAHEVAEADPDVIEACLAHGKRGVRGVYNRASYLSKRRELLQKWADQCTAWGMKL